VLLSGGLDSATTLAYAKAEGLDCYALTCLYGQRHRVEVEAARNVARALGVSAHLVVTVDLGSIGGSALTDRGIQVPRGPGQVEGIPVTYVPARNTVLLAIALAWAEVLEAFDIFIGVHMADAGGYPDCTQGFIKAFEDLANLATAAAVEGRGRFRIHAPFVHMTKAEIIAKGLQLHLDYSLTRSCYDPDPQGLSCGQCLACQMRLRAFAELGLADPIPYRQGHAGR